jgi:uncharacterized repeat protein (TIGR03803 family)
MFRNITHSCIAVCGLMPAMLLPLDGAQAKFSVLYDFKGGRDGSESRSGLLMDDAGNLYGTTRHGGAKGCGGCGTVFKIAPDGTEQVLYAFSGGSDGGYPEAVNLIADKSGNLYGTTSSGGDEGCGCGTVFKLAPDGTETVLYAFTGGTDGSGPYAGLIADQAGNLYGTTAGGGGTGCGGSGCGTVFRLAPDGTETVLYAFQGGKTDGSSPESPLIMDKQGDLYGTTNTGGGTGCNNLGCGTVFKLTPGGVETLLHAFKGGMDGANDSFDDFAGLIADSDGNLYGTTYAGGGGAACGSSGCGTVFRVAPNGTEKVLYAFQSGTDGGGPYAGVVADKAGNLYGAAAYGGGTSCGCGVVYKLAPDGTLSVLHVFTSGKDGWDSQASLLLSNGYLYGTAMLGGHHDNGAVFKVKKQ